MEQTILKRVVVCLIVSTSFLISCEKEETLNSEDVPQNTNITKPEYSIQELQNVLDEEIELAKNGYVTDISGMDIVKENPKKVYVHYLPWFQSLEYDGWWSQHWTMVNMDPNIVDENGKREIASFYYPVIGPYSSSDPDLHEYHFAMMKLTGVDGVIFDWYGSQDLYDYGLIKNATETFIDTLEDLGMDFAIMYEDRVAVQMANLDDNLSIAEAIGNDFSYIKNEYFNSPRYLTFNDKKLLFVFGPNHVTSENIWDEAFEVFDPTDKPDFLTLWAARNRVGINATGEFLWVDKDHLVAHDHYYYNYPASNSITVGSAYPGFNNFSEIGGWGLHHDWTLDHDNGNMFVETLNYTHHEVADIIQLLTWNDFGEGTMIEPTEEFGFTFLQILQEYTGVTHTTDDLQIALDLYNSRKAHPESPLAQSLLDRSYQYMKQLNLTRSDMIIQAVNTFL